MRNIHSFIAIQLMMVILMLFGCKTTSDEQSIDQTDDLKKSIAYFDYFQYSGKDSFYDKNLLPGSDYYYNPILPGWYSDPSICRKGEDYFLALSTFSYFPGVPVFHSRDLMNWQPIGHVLTTTSQLDLSGQRVSEGIFAPAISYNPYNETFYMITTNIRKGNFFVKTKDPFAGWSEPVWLPNVHGIDPSFFFDEDGKAYIVNNDVPDGGSTYDGHRAIRVIQFDVETEQTKGESIMLVNGGVNLSEKPIWIEGPHLYKINGSYYLMCAEGGTGPDHSEVIFRGESPTGPFIPRTENPIMTQRHLDSSRPNPVTCTGHADLIQKPNGDWWGVFLACRPISNQFENLGRETFLLPVKWSEDDYPYFLEGNEEVPMVVQMPGVNRAETTTFGNFTVTDNFDKPALGAAWMTLRGPADTLYSLADRAGNLALKCAPVSAEELKVPAFVARRLQHHVFEVTSQVTFQPSDTADAAGLLLFKDEAHQYFLALRAGTDQNLEVGVYQISDQGIKELALVNLPDGLNTVQLRIRSTGVFFAFDWSVDGLEWNNLTESANARYLSTANSWGFTGTTVGMYATSVFNP